MTITTDAGRFMDPLHLKKIQYLKKTKMLYHFFSSFMN